MHPPEPKIVHLMGFREADLIYDLVQSLLIIRIYIRDGKFVTILPSLCRGRKLVSGDPIYPPVGHTQTGEMSS